jgi:hypothetical protein
MNLLARPGGAPVRSTPVEDYPRQPTPITAPPDSVISKPGQGIKASTIGTTVYLLPAEHKRIKQLALDMDVASVHELLLLGLDRLLAEQGNSPIVRYTQPRARKI